jgi:serine protease Do
MFMERVPMKSFVWLPVLFIFGLAPVATAEDPADSAPPEAKPWFVDDEKLFADFMEKLTGFAKEGKCLANELLVAKLKSGTKAKIALTKPNNKFLTPDEVYKTALPSVFIVGSVHKNKGKNKENKDNKEDKEKECEWRDGLYATAWVAAEDGVLVTNWHVFEDLEDSEVFGAVDYKGNVYPVIDFLGGDKVSDVAIVRIDAKGLKPLPLADNYAEIGSWAGVLGHPGDNYFVFTQGFVTRYSTNKNDEGKRESWMGLTAEYAGGSSGSPVLDRHGAVVGMATLTLTIDGTPGAATPNRRRFLLGQPPAKAPPPREKIDPKDPPKPEQMPGAGSSVQMILKMAVPGPVVLKLFEKP